MAADLEESHLLLSAYRPVLAAAADAVALDVGVVPAARIKNTATILEQWRLATSLRQILTRSTSGPRGGWAPRQSA